MIRHYNWQVCDQLKIIYYYTLKEESFFFTFSELHCAAQTATKVCRSMFAYFDVLPNVFFYLLLKATFSAGRTARWIELELLYKKVKLLWQWATNCREYLILNMAALCPPKDKRFKTGPLRMNSRYPYGTLRMLPRQMSSRWDTFVWPSLQTRWRFVGAVSYTHLTLPTNREV